MLDRDLPRLTGKEKKGEENIRVEKVVLQLYLKGIQGLGEM